MLSHQLIIFVKNPELGKVKTRLAASVGDEEALKIYQYLLNYTKRVVTAISCGKRVMYSSFIDQNDNWGAASFKKSIQKGKELGERMKNAFQDIFEEEDHSKVVLIGSDCGELTPRILDQAFIALDNHEVVIGPAKDGGYYLIGMTDFHATLFEGISWSTSSVFEGTVKKAEQLFLKIYTLPMLNDVDTFKDWEKVRSRVLQYA